MRSEKEVLNQLLSFAENNDRVRAVLLNGSRVNPNIKNDIFSDYDVIFAVTDPDHFLNNQEWIQYFGEIIIMQQNNIHTDNEDWYIFLMIFTDGVRIDLSFRKIENINVILDDSLTKKLLDKDNVIGALEHPSEKSYYISQPTKHEFNKAINEIWWVSTNVAKGIWRDELPYAKFMLDNVNKIALIKLLNWYIGMNYQWTINTGFAGRWFKKYLPTALWESYEKTYTGSNYEDIWNSLFEMGRLTRKIGIQMADQLGYNYPFKDDERVSEYLKKVRLLSKEASSLD